MKKFLLILLIFSLPTFGLMLNFGIYTMHDFHVFRMYEFSQCISGGVFPCRWSANSGMGYGEPMFNFYGQFPYWIGEVFRIAAFSVIDSAKAVFILSLIGSGVTMFFFARRYWGNLGGLLSGVFYMYAPYRAVDVWVRGALPEALSFVFFPLIFYSLDRYLYLKKIKYLLLFSLCFAILIINHNLSTYMIFPFIVLFWLFRALRTRSLRTLFPLTLSGIFSLLLTAFYLLPVALENSFTTVTATTQSYYNFQLHYATLKQLFISRFWGYGGSSWGPNDTLSFSVGHMHWLIPILIAIFLIIRPKSRPRESGIFFFSIIMGFVALFLTHGKSEFIWKLIPGMSFVQFPWRFLSPSIFFLSLAVGILPQLLIAYRHLLSGLALIAVVVLNYGFYRPDIWRPIGDSGQFSGKLWDEQRSSALQDYWPKSASFTPDTFAPADVIISQGSGQYLDSRKEAQSAWYLLNISTKTAKVSFPIVYFPGWVGRLDNQPVPVGPDDSGLISTQVSQGDHQISLEFVDTPVRYYGNLISIISLVAWLGGFMVSILYEKK